MIKNLIIAIETIIILGVVVLIYFTLHQPSESNIIRFPEIKLGDNERITQAELIFQSTYIKSIRNIPPAWYANIDLNVPPNPIFKGSIINGAAALGSSKELPEFEVDSYSTGTEPKALRAIFMVAKYPGDFDDERTIEIEVNKP